jgi:hypothetical protein
MMVPEMLGDLISIVVQTDRKIETVLDPFAGAGTVLTESMLLGRNFVAHDVNPLAVLLCKTKSGPFRHAHLADVAAQLKSRILSDTSEVVEADFYNRDKWFSGAVSVQLSRIRRAVRKECDLWCRRFFWVALAETVRLTSNSRTSTFKLHIRSAEERAIRRVSPRDVFEQVLERNLCSLQEFRDALAERKLLSRGAYAGEVLVRMKDAGSIVGRPPMKCDLLVTSPPYGDNTTTVPYGQHSYLPLQWIDLDDIDSSLDSRCLKTTHEIDRRSLGGSRRDAITRAEGAVERSPSLARFLKSIRHEPPDRRTRTAAFIADLDKSLDPILKTLRKHAYMIWVVGNRRVAGRQLPTDAILHELLVARNSIPVVEICRNIPTKRMALKNSVTSTMIKEKILVFRHTGAS